MDGFVLKCRVISAFASMVPIAHWARMTGTNPVIFYYHMVSDADVAHVKHLYQYKSVKIFRTELDFILRHYSPIALSDLLDHLRRGVTLPERAFMLSFDDGFREMHDIVAPILLEKGVPAVFFLNSGFIDNRQLCYLHKASLLAERLRTRGQGAFLEGVSECAGRKFREAAEFAAWLKSVPYGERSVLDRVAGRLDVDFEAYLRDHEPYLTSAQTRSLIRDGFAVGAHSIDHPPYADIAIGEQFRQTVESVRFVRELFGLSYGAFAFPHNDFGVREEFFRRLGESGTVDISFGTGGMIAEQTPRHLQRCSLENPPLPAGRIIALEYARKMFRIARGSDRVGRN